MKEWKTEDRESHAEEDEVEETGGKRSHRAQGAEVNANVERGQGKQQW
eukprot:COSAG06_NODE_16184_length_1015_cov_10.889738_1_plen_47_part_10